MYLHVFLYFRNRLFGDDGLSTNTPSRTVLVTGLDPSITAADLRKTFEQYGDILVSYSQIFVLNPSNEDRNE